MPLFTDSVIRKRAQFEIQKRGFTKSSSQIMNELLSANFSNRSFDIFLSHSFQDSELILGIKEILSDLGYTVFIDWIDDPQLDRTKVSSETAEKLKKRMQSSKSLFYVTTSNAEGSKWMPWECGYFDGHKEKVAILPITTTSNDNTFNGQEYLSLYPYIIKQADSVSHKEILWIMKNSKKYISYDFWVKTPNNKIEWSEN